MMLSDVLGDVGRALGQVRGSAAVAVLRDDEPGRLVLARRTRRPVVIGHGDGIVLFASTREALDVIARNAGLQLEVEALRDGTLVEIEDGREVARRELPGRLPLPRAQARRVPRPAGQGAPPADGAREPAPRLSRRRARRAGVYQSGCRFALGSSGVSGAGAWLRLVRRPAITRSSKVAHRTMRVHMV